MARGALNTAAVVDAAAKLADKEGLDGLTLSRLAAQLGIKPPSLHKHIDSLDSLRRELALRGLREANQRMTRGAVGRSGEDALLGIGRAYREFAGEHPGLYAASLRMPQKADPEWAKAGEEAVATAVAVMAGFGLRGADALHATRAVRAIIHGFVSLEAAGGFGLPLSMEESLDRLVRTFARGLAAGPVAKRTRKK